MAKPIRTPDYARALVDVHARQLRETVEEVIKITHNEIVQHRLAEVCAECAWCEREYGESDNARS